MSGGSLVIGGCGFLGYHLVRHLLDDDDDSLGPVHVFDLNVTNNLVDGVASYTKGAITDEAAVKAILDKLQPRVVFHMASPPASLPAHRKNEFHTTNVVGTAILLKAAAACPSVEAFVYTSTVDVYAGPPHDNVGEDHALWTDVWSPGTRKRRPSKMSEYCYTKAVGDGLARAANSESLKTVVIRPGHVYGERHQQGLYEMLEAAKGNSPLFQVGGGPGKEETVLMEVASADNVASGHVLAAKALLSDKDGVAGQAFNISDGSPVPFWHHVRVIWGVARGKEALQNIWVLPAWLMVVVAFVAEWAFWAFSLGKAEPPTELTSASLSYCIESHSYSVDKARRLLGFKPVANHDEVLAESVRWELRRRGEPIRG